MDNTPRRDDSDNQLLFKIASSVNTLGGGEVLSFNTRTGAVTLTSGDVTVALGFTPISNSVTGDLTISGQFLAHGTGMTDGHLLEVTDALTNLTPIALRLTHTLSAGNGANGIGVTLDWAAQDSTTAGSRMARWITDWTDATHATRTSRHQFFLFSGGSEGAALIVTMGQVQANPGLVGTPSFTNRNDPDNGLWFPTTNTVSLAAGGTDMFRANATQIGFFGVTPAVRQTVPTGSSTDTVITALQTLGLFKQA